MSTQTYRLRAAGLRSGRLGLRLDLVDGYIYLYLYVCMHTYNFLSIYAHIYIYMHTVCGQRGCVPAALASAWISSIAFLYISMHAYTYIYAIYVCTYVYISVFI